MGSNCLGMDFWRQHVRQCQREGISQAAYCRQHDLVVHQFGYWHRKLSSREDAKWLPVEVKPVSESANTIDLVLSNDRMLRIANGFDVALLKQVIVAVEAMP